jgi:hypothetical protein
MFKEKYASKCEDLDYLGVEVAELKSRPTLLGACTSCPVLHGKIEGPIWQTREGGSEWEPIKILPEGYGGSNKMNTTSNTRLRLTTKVLQAHATTGVLLDLGTNSQPHRPENAAEHKT